MSSLPRPSPRVARKRARARAEILEATRAVVQRDGVERLTIDAVAVEADVSKPAVYYYFASKEALARALTIEESRVEVAVLREAIDRVVPGVSVVEAVVRAYVDHHLASLHLFRAAYVWGQLLAFEREDVDAVNADMVGVFEAFERRLRQDADAGLLDEGVHPRRVAMSVWMAAHGLVATLGLLASTDTQLLHRVPDMVDEMVGMLNRGVYRRAGARPARGRGGPRLKRARQRRRRSARRAARGSAR